MSEKSPSSRDDVPRPRSIAIVSGKGGSGKTMFTSVLAKVLDRAGYPVTIIDADTGTGGMTYYLGLKKVSNTTVGLADLLDGKMGPRDVLQKIDGFANASFVGMGDHRQVYAAADKKTTEASPRPPGAEPDPRVVGPVEAALGRVLDEMQDGRHWVLVDCRGGIDHATAAVCGRVDDVILIVESDTTSFQASQYLVEVLSSHGVSRKIQGFVVNKVFDDPTVIARSGTSVFRSRSLGAIPFDMEATRDFLVGAVPELSSPFGIHVWAAARKAYPALSPPEGRPWSEREFGEVGLSDPDSIRGGIAISGAILLSLLAWLLMETAFLSVSPNSFIASNLLLAGALLGLAAGFEPARRMVGRVISGYVSMISRVVGRRER